MRAYATVYNVGDMLEGFATVKRLASSPAHVIPGHDPLVLRRYPAPKPELEGIAVRLDVEPQPLLFHAGLLGDADERVAALQHVVERAERVHVMAAEAAALDPPEHVGEVD